MLVRAKPINALAAAALALLAGPAWAVRIARRSVSPGSKCSSDRSKMGRVSFCVMNLTQRCPLSSMQPDKSTMVYPGGKTRCISSEWPWYAFQVVPKRSDRLLIMFDSGGACWDKLSLDANACEKQSVFPWSLTGIMSRSSSNPFRDYTVLYIQYCTGDLHAGNVTQPFNTTKGGPVHQYGYHNALSAINWAKANLDGTLESLLLSGLSAGSIGMQVWASKLLREFKYQHAAVIADSYAGAFPEGFQGPVFRSLGVCDLDLLTPELRGSCATGGLTIPDVFDSTIQEFPHIAFASMDSMHDKAQMNFYGQAQVSMGRMPEIAEAQFFRHLSRILMRYDRHPNHVSFLRSSQWHGYTACDLIYNVTVHLHGKEQLISNWLTRFNSDAPNRTIASVCEDVAFARSVCTRILDKSVFHA